MGINPQIHSDGERGMTTTDIGDGCRASVTFYDAHSASVAVSHGDVTRWADHMSDVPVTDRHGFLWLRRTTTAPLFIVEQVRDAIALPKVQVLDDVEDAERRRTRAQDLLDEVEAAL